MISFAQIGNDLYTGRRSVDFIGRQKRWYAFSAVLIAVALLGIFGKGLNFGIEFTGGSEFRVSGASSTQDYESKAQDAVGEAGISQNITTTVIGQDTIRIQTEAAEEKNEAVKTELGKAFGVPTTQVSSSLIGPSWGESVSEQAVRALIVFLLLVTAVMAIYFRTWKMAVAALVALLHDLVITVGIYALFGFEITPASMIGFLTILGYSLYDTVVVFDKVRENTAEAFRTKRMTYAQAANLAVNQTLVRSINTSVVALLPIAAILVVGFTLLGPGTLLDLALALFIGIAAGAYSSIFIATPLLVDLRKKEPAVRELDKYVARHGVRHESVIRAQSHGGEPGEPEAPVAVGADSSTGARPVHRYAQTSGPRNQPRRAPKSKR